MVDVQRPAVAGIVYRLITGGDPKSIYSFGEGKYYRYAGTADKGGIYLHDEARKRYITGYQTFPDKYSLYDYGTRCYLTLDINYYAFSGYDYRTQTYFGGNVSGNYISVFDYGTGRYYTFAGSVIGGHADSTPKNAAPLVPASRNSAPRTDNKNAPAGADARLPARQPRTASPEPRPRPAARTAAEAAPDVSTLEQTLESLKADKKALKEKQKELKTQLKAEKRKNKK